MSRAMSAPSCTSQITRTMPDPSAERKCLRRVKDSVILVSWMEAALMGSEGAPATDCKPPLNYNRRGAPIPLDTHHCEASASREVAAMITAGELKESQFLRNL